MHPKIRRLRKSLKAISPVLAVLMMIAIAIAGSLITYAWVTGYISFTTEKAGKAIMIQSVANSGADLMVYVQNVGDGTVELDPDSCLYRNGELTPCDITIGGTPVATEETGLLPEGDTAELKLTDGAAAAGEKVTVKVTTLLGTFTEKSNYPTSGQTAYTLTVETIGTGGTVTKNPDQETYSPGDIVELTANPTTGWIFTEWNGDLTGTNNPETITMDNHKTVQATFAQQVTLLDDDFENWNTWDATPSSWYLSPDQDHNGRYSAKTTDGQEGDFICDPLDTRNSEAVTLDFWYRLANGVDGGDFRVYFYDGSNWDQIVDLGSQSEGSWRHYTYATTDSQYFKSNFRIRFYSYLSGSETIWIDDVTIIKTTSTVLDDGFEGSSSSWDNNWDNTGHDWYRSTTRHSGSYAAGSRNNDEGYFYSDPRDTRNSIALIVDFWYRLDDTEDGDFRLYFYDGSNYDTIESNLGDGSEDTWRHYTYTTTSSQYFRSNFRIRFRTNLSSGENVWVDDVKIISVKTSDSLLTDGFETWDDNWDATSASWLLGADQHHSGSYSAKTTNGQEGNFYSDPIDTSQAISIEIDFWYRVDDLEDNDLQLHYYDGSNYDFITNLGTDPEDTWRHYNHVIIDSQYFKSNFRIRFSSSPDNSGENAWIDDVTITMTYIP